MSVNASVGWRPRGCSGVAGAKMRAMYCKSSLFVIHLHRGEVSAAIPVRSPMGEVTTAR